VGTVKIVEKDSQWFCIDSISCHTGFNDCDRPARAPGDSDSDLCVYTNLSFSILFVESKLSFSKRFLVFSLEYSFALAYSSVSDQVSSFYVRTLLVSCFKTSPESAGRCSSG
jgi:hypothetical protein